MTPKEKAMELVDKYRTYIRKADSYNYLLSDDEIYLAKQCALIAVDEILNTLNGMKLIFSDRELVLRFWREVKQELEKL